MSQAAPAIPHLITPVSTPEGAVPVTATLRRRSQVGQPLGRGVGRSKSPLPHRAGVQSAKLTPILAASDDFMENLVNASHKRAPLTGKSSQSTPIGHVPLTPPLQPRPPSGLSKSTSPAERDVLQPWVTLTFSKMKDIVLGRGDERQAGGRRVVALNAIRELCEADALVCLSERMDRQRRGSDASTDDPVGEAVAGHSATAVSNLAAASLVHPSFASWKEKLVRSRRDVEHERRHIAVSHRTCE